MTISGPASKEPGVTRIRIGGGKFGHASAVITSPSEQAFELAIKGGSLVVEGEEFVVPSLVGQIESALEMHKAMIAALTSSLPEARGVVAAAKAEAKRLMADWQVLQSGDRPRSRGRGGVVV